MYSRVFVNMCVGVYQSVVISALLVLRTSIGDVVQLCVCNLGHSFL